jgi:hypothetical protein
MSLDPDVDMPPSLKYGKKSFGLTLRSRASLSVSVGMNKHGVKTSQWIYSKQSRYLSRISGLDLKLCVPVTG